LEEHRQGRFSWGRTPSKSRPILTRFQTSVRIRRASPTHNSFEVWILVSSRQIVRLGEAGRKHDSLRGSTVSGAQKLVVGAKLGSQ
jgi:hypothetical protein